MSKALPSIFGINNRSMYTVPVGPAAAGLKQLRAITKKAIQASVTPYQVGSARFPNGKKAKLLK